jgi:hypothetical protein
MDEFVKYVFQRIGPRYPIKPTVAMAADDPDIRKALNQMWRETQESGNENGGWISWSKGLNGDVGTGAFSPDGTVLATSSGRGRIALWGVPDGKLKEALLGRSTQGRLLAFSPDGKTLAAADRHGAIERWAIPGGRPAQLVLCPAVEAQHAWYRIGYDILYPQGIAFADNERVVAWGALWSRTIAWEVPSGKLLTPLPTHPTEIQSVRCGGTSAPANRRSARPS